MSTPHASVLRKGVDILLHRPNPLHVAQHKLVLVYEKVCMKGFLLAGSVLSRPTRSGTAETEPGKKKGGPRPSC